MDNFFDLCQFRAEKLKSDPSILYEKLPDGVKEMFIEYNKLGFLTFTSQPGGECKNLIFKSAMHRFNCNKSRKSPEPDDILGEGIRRQRAFVRGFMDQKMADFVFNKLKDDSYIFIRTEKNNLPFPHEVKFGSVKFFNDQPLVTEDIGDYDPNGPDGDWTFNLGLSLRKPFSLLLGKEYPNIDSTNIIEVEVLDTRWNENSYLWIKLLETIREYQNI